MEKTEKGRNWVLWVILGLMAVLAIAAILGGISFYWIAVESWLEHGNSFNGWELLAWFLGLCGAAAIHVGLLILGFFCRFLPWGKAPLCSLGLAIATVPYILFTYVMFSSPLESVEGLQSIFLAIGGVFSLCILTLPPFLHWLNAPGTALPVTQAARTDGSARS